jgi:2-amino-4-hydroxy-6-hydroxymethyldihydropteridine diphosphokinase
VDLDEAVVVALGGNLPGAFVSSEALLEAAVGALVEAELPVLARSGWWRSTAWPDPSGPEYRNGIVLVEAHAGPHALLAQLFEVEAAFRRIRGGKNDPRTLDLDLIAYGRLVLDERGLTLPHPRAHDRRFVMGPLAQIAPDWVHPGLGRTAAELAASAGVGRDAEPA